MMMTTINLRGRIPTSTGLNLQQNKHRMNLGALIQLHSNTICEVTSITRIGSRSRSCRFFFKRQSSSLIKDWLFQNTPHFDFADASQNVSSITVPRSSCNPLLRYKPLRNFQQSQSSLKYHEVHQLSTPKNISAEQDDYQHDLHRLLTDILACYDSLKNQQSHSNTSKRFNRKASLLDHQILSSLIKLTSDRISDRSIEIYNDLSPVWGYEPTQEDRLNRLIASLASSTSSPVDINTLLPLGGNFFQQSPSYHLAQRFIALRDSQFSDSHPNQTELAGLIRLAIQDNLESETTLLVEKAHSLGLHESLAIQGALLAIDDLALDYVLSQLKSGVKLDDWLEINLLRRLSFKLSWSETSVDDVFKIIHQLHSHHITQDRSITIIETISSGLILSAGLEGLDPLADRLLEITNVDIFRDLTDRSLAKIFGPLILQLGFEEVCQLYRLMKSRRAEGEIWIRCLKNLARFETQLAQTPALVHQLVQDLRSDATSTSISSLEGAVALDLFDSTSISLLRAVIRAQQPQYVETILETLVARHLNNRGPIRRPIETETLIEILPALISVAIDREQAYRLYQSLIQIGKPNTLLFQRFLTTYLHRCESPTSSSRERPQALSIHRLMSILDQMNLSNCPPDHETYMILLQHFSRVTRSNPRNLSTKLQLERLYTLIKLDIRLEPDSPLLHELLKGFSYNGSYQNAWKIWDILSNQSRFKDSMTNASVATILDMAGYESERYGDGRLNQRAIEAWDELIKSKGSHPMKWKSCQLNKNLWDSWIECLCRCRRIEEAIEEVFENMQKSQIVADQRTFSILLRFIRRELELERQFTDGGGKMIEIWNSVRKRIQNEFQDQWEFVQDEGLTPNEIEKQSSQ